MRLPSNAERHYLRPTRQSGKSQRLLLTATANVQDSERTYGSLFRLEQGSQYAAAVPQSVQDQPTLGDRDHDQDNGQPDMSLSARSQSVPALPQPMLDHFS